jgi:hypothetical protein
MGRDELAGRDRLTSGSGCLVVVPIDRGDQSGSNGGGLKAAVAVLAELWWFWHRRGGRGHARDPGGGGLRHRWV